MAAEWIERGRANFSSTITGVDVALYKINAEPEWVVYRPFSFSDDPIFSSMVFKAKNANDAKAKAWGVVLDAIESRVAEMRREVEAKVD